jgi:hypothetical protein
MAAGARKIKRKRKEKEGRREGGGRGGAVQKPIWGGTNVPGGKGARGRDERRKVDQDGGPSEHTEDTEI